MTVKQALKAKNKLVVSIMECYSLAKEYNSIEEGNPRRYSVIGLLNEANELTRELVELKAKIHRANAPVFDKIFLMAELKGRVKFLKSIPVDEGKVSDRYSLSSGSVKEVELNVADRNAMIKGLETEIEELQEQLDLHNATTTI